MSHAMKQNDLPPVYAQVAYDIAAKIVAGEYNEGERITGRSLMGSQYSVSPETIRRAISHLDNLGIVEVRPNVGSTVVSKDRAREYVERYQARHEILTLKKRLTDLIAERDALNDEINNLFLQISDMQERFGTSDRVRTYKFRIVKSSVVCGKTIGELRFRQEYSGTIVAIERGVDVQFSPGPQTVLLPDDLLTIACEASYVERMAALFR